MLVNALERFVATGAYDALGDVWNLLDEFEEERIKNSSVYESFNVNEIELLKRCFALLVDADDGACARLLRSVARCDAITLGRLELDVCFNATLHYLENNPRSTSLWCTNPEEAPGIDPIALECALVWSRSFSTSLSLRSDMMERALRIALWRPWRTVVSSDSALSFITQLCSSGSERCAFEILEFLRWCLRIENCHSWSSDPWLRAHAFSVASRVPFELFKVYDSDFTVVKGLLHQATCEPWSHACSVSSSSNEFVAIEDVSANESSRVWFESLSFLASTMLHAPKDVTLRKPETCSAMGNALNAGLDSSLVDVRLRAMQVFRYWGEAIRDDRIGRLRRTWSETTEEETLTNRRQARKALLQVAASGGENLVTEPRAEKTNSLSPWLSRVMPRLCTDSEAYIAAKIQRNQHRLSLSVASKASVFPSHPNGHAPTSLKRPRQEEPVFGDENEMNEDVEDEKSMNLQRERLQCLGSLAVAAGRDMQGTVTLSTWDLVRLVINEANSRRRGTIGTSPTKRTRLNHVNNPNELWSYSLDACASHFLRLRAEDDAPIWIVAGERQCLMDLAFLIRESLMSLEIGTPTKDVLSGLCCLTRILALSCDDDETRRRVLRITLDVLNAILIHPSLTQYNLDAWDEVESILNQCEELGLMALRLSRAINDESCATSLIDVFQRWYTASTLSQSSGFVFHRYLVHPSFEIKIESILRRNFEDQSTINGGNTYDSTSSQWTGMIRALRYASSTLNPNALPLMQELLTGMMRRLEMSLRNGLSSPKRFVVVMEALIFAASIPLNSINLEIYSPLWQALQTHLSLESVNDVDNDSSSYVFSIVRTKALRAWSVLTGTMM